MESLSTIQSVGVLTRANQARSYAWAFVPAFLLVHGIVATCLPAWLDPLSTVFIVLAEWTAIAACLGASRRAEPPTRMFWFLLVAAIVLHSAAMSMDALTEITNAPMLNHVPAISILFSMFWGVPLLVAVSLQNDHRVLLPARLIGAALSLAIGAVIYLEIFSFLPLGGSPNLSDAVRVTHLFDLLDGFLAVAATVRWLGSSGGEERRFFRVLTIFLWGAAIFGAVHNRILLSHNWDWLDLLISAPYALLVPLSLTGRRDRLVKFRSRAFIRAVRTGSPIFLAGALVVAGVVESHSHFYVGLSAALFAIAGYGAINILVLSRGLETEESLMASNAVLEQMVGEDGLTGVANRRAFDETLRRACTGARRTRQPVSLLMIDVDLFKELNDAVGHVAADEYLVQIATVLRLTLARATDMVARYGGDEFSAILPATDRGGALIAAEKVRDAVASLGLRHAAARGGIATVSIGISTFDGSMPPSPEDLTESADRGLYIAKREGRDRSVFQPMEDVNRVVLFPSVR